ncbi:hypothetical protein CLIB1423_09S04918 [[Candida] railenensis]|uniref:Zn(2)-C6 fungal-type domain-containing protein n=1 Tax=[Candida] railenensis TaxID=45579 RepID=A0A9P0VYR4_9ASCO|nr:hypothetical protein CLIB1423_09S04918 [[Candida] railenensis]
MNKNEQEICTEEYDSEIYTNIHQYLGKFQIPGSERLGDDLSCEKASKSSSLSASITVFRKKSLDELYIDPKERDPRVLSPKNIYEHNLEVPELDTLDSSKSKNSCSRCRKLKRRCSRELPECQGCSSSDKLCVYIPRRSSKSSIGATSRRDSVCSTSSTSTAPSSKRRRTSSVLSVLFEGRSRQNSSELPKVKSFSDLNIARKNSLHHSYSYQQSHSSPSSLASTPPSSQYSCAPMVRLPPIEFILNSLPNKKDWESSQPHTLMKPVQKE